MAGLGSLSGNLAIDVAVTAALTGAGSLTADVEVNPLAPALTGLGTLSGTLSGETPVAAAITGTGALSGSLDSVLVPAEASLTGAGSLAGLLSGITAFEAAATGTGTLSGALVPHIPVAAVLAGAGSLSSAVAIDVPIASALSGAGTLSATVDVPVAGDTAIASMLTGAGSLAGSVAVDITVDAALSGAGSLSATLDAPAPVVVRPDVNVGGGSLFPFPMLRKVPEPVLAKLDYTFATAEAVMMGEGVVILPAAGAADVETPGVRLMREAAIGDALMRAFGAEITLVPVMSLLLPEVRVYHMPAELRDIVFAETVEPLLLLEVA